MNVYAESSAVLAWLLDEPRARDVLRHLAESEAVLSSDSRSSNATASSGGQSPSTS